MNGEQLFMLLFGLIILGYVVLYMGGRNYLRDGFQSGSGAGAGSPSVSQLFPTPMPVLAKDTNEDGPGRVLMEYTTADPVAKGRIDSISDYEYNMIFQEESDNREISQALKNKLMSQRPMEWAGLPPSSEKFQAGLRESFENATPSVPNNPQPFTNISGENMVPPDTEGTEMEERKIVDALFTIHPNSALVVDVMHANVRQKSNRRKEDQEEKQRRNEQGLQQIKHLIGESFNRK